ncbi:hypothetical protein AAFP30_14850 [Gordonia sp. CPCC 205515]|uniref:hypothetical protein n=1 Tax=Gordonia sp. CPCC 205515 TaxID=3140791 RepID=UPI003AF3DF78
MSDCDGQVPPTSSGTRVRSSQPDFWPWVYVVASPFLAILAGMVALGLTKGGGDFCDRSLSVAERASDAARWQWLLSSVSVVMLCGGVFMIARIILLRHKMDRYRWLRLAASAAAVLVVMLGWVFVLVIGDPQTDCG